MKLLVVVSSLDLTQPYSSTPGWWQLLKGLHEVGVEIIAVPYQGAAVGSLWWQCEQNPARWQGDAYRLARDVMRRLRRGQSIDVSEGSAEESLSDKVRAQPGTCCCCTDMATSPRTHPTAKS